MMGSDKPPLREKVEGFCGGADSGDASVAFAKIRCTSIEGINDVVGVRTRIEKAHRQRLPVKRITVQIELTAEFSLHAPEAVGCAIRHLACFQGMLPIECAA